MDLVGFGDDPFPVFPVFTFLSYFSDVYFRIEVCSKWFSVITGVAVDYVKIMYLIKMMSGSWL
jgi:hypothetical protein